MSFGFWNLKDGLSLPVLEYQIIILPNYQITYYYIFQITKLPYYQIIKLPIITFSRLSNYRNTCNRVPNKHLKISSLTFPNHFPGGGNPVLYIFSI